MKRVVITGATGGIGRALTAALRQRGDAVVALSRDEARGRQVLGDGVEVITWPDPIGSPPGAEALTGADAVVNLLGEPVAQRWSGESKARIRDSRVQSTRQLVTALGELPPGERPAVLVSQSATGYYGPSDDRELDETAPAGHDFLAQVVTAWEDEAKRAEPLLRVATTRTGVVLSPSGGALAQMLPFFRLGVGGPVAGGKQFVPWVHLDDVVAALTFSLDEPAATGAINVTSPHPVTNAEFSRALGRALHRPAVLPVPGFALRSLYGDMAQIVITGQRVIPRRLEELGFRFRHPDLDSALRDVLAEP
ncbi:MAG: TIGR01777 family oxidoreductase [Solirubrobacterales bacterium]|nr:TIGR01777 family oxidoreductase [Solirubrobacterales bacterium]